MTQPSADSAALSPQAEALIASIAFNADGLVPAIAQDATDGAVLMLAWMNAESIRETLRQGRVVYWSRSRQEFWRKGDSSGHIQALREMRLDCDRDCLLLSVDQTGPACHTGRRSCFYTLVGPGDAGDDGAP